MQYSIPIQFLLLLWLFTLHPAVGQNRGPPTPRNGDSGSSVERRCVRLTRRQNQRPVRLLPMSCNNMGFYNSEDAVFNGSRINRLPRVLDNIKSRTESADNPECAETVQRYLCHYYFPRCNLTTGEIIPVCDSSCELLFDNDNCNELFTIASQELGTIISNIPIPDESCLRTHRSFNNRPPSESDKCTEIKVPLPVATNNETISNESINITNNETTIDAINNNDITNSTTTDTSNNNDITNSSTTDTSNNNDITNNGTTNTTTDITNNSTTNDIVTNNNDTDIATTNNDTNIATTDNDTDITNSGTTNNNSNIELNQPAGRCTKFRGPQSRSVPMACNNLRFYDRDDAVFNESRIRNLQRVLDRIIFQTINAESVDDPECTESLQRYLCHYYFPRCNMTTGGIIPVCNNNCELLFDNDNCNELFRLASQELNRSNLPIPDASCLTTHVSFNNPPPVSNKCTEIEVPLSDDANDDNSDATNDDADSTSTNADATTDDDSNNNGIVIGAVVAIVAAVVIVIITILIVVLVVRRSRSNSERVFESVEEPENEEHREDRYILTQVSQHSDDDKAAKDNSSEVKEILKYVEERFSDILFPKGVVVKSELIGKGAFGVVHKGELKNSNNTITAVAIKSIKSQSLDAMKDLVAESSIMKTFDHPNVLPLLGVCIDYDDEDVLKVVMPFMANGDLKTYLKNNRVTPSNTREYSKALSENILTRMCLDIAKGMEYVAQKRVVHRDLAARNCMVDERLTIRVADFGLTRDIYSTEYYRADKHATLPVKWMSLESLLDGYFNEQTDVWSYGVTCWEIFSLGRIPYPGVDNADVINFLKHGKRLDKPELCPSMMFEMIETMWQEESSERPTFAEIVETLQTNIRKASITSETDDKKYNYVDILPQ